MGILFSIANLLLTIITLAILIRALLSWVMPNMGNNGWSRILVDLTEPILAPIRNLLLRILPIPIDLSPIVAIILIRLLQDMLANAARGMY